MSAYSLLAKSKFLRKIISPFIKRSYAEELSPRHPQKNKQLAMREFRAGKTRVKSKPETLTIESTSRCNLRCVMCPHGIGGVDRPKHLEPSLVKKLDNFLVSPNSVQLHGIGEPLASPAFWKLLKLVPTPDICESSINTNLTVLDDRRLEWLMASNLRLLNVSLDAATSATYRKIRGFDFSLVVNNIKKVIASRNARKSSYPIVVMNMTLMKTNIEEVVDFVRLASSLGADRVMLYHLNHYSDVEMSPYVVQRDDWVFDYKKEGLWNYPKLSNANLRKAEAEAHKLGIDLHLDPNKTVYFDEQLDPNTA